MANDKEINSTMITDRHIHEPVIDSAWANKAMMNMNWGIHLNTVFATHELAEAFMKGHEAA